jgi:hypothetical protein
VAVVLDIGAVEGALVPSHPVRSRVGVLAGTTDHGDMSTAPTASQRVAYSGLWWPCQRRQRARRGHCPRDGTKEGTYHWVAVAAVRRWRRPAGVHNDALRRLGRDARGAWEVLVSTAVVCAACGNASHSGTSKLPLSAYLVRGHEETGLPLAGRVTQ